MWNVNEEKNLQDPSSNGSASGQEEDAGCFKARKCGLLPAWRKNKKLFLMVISLIIWSLIVFGLGTLVPLNQQKEAIKCPPDWIGHHGYCYKFSRDEKNWKESQNFCILHNASLAKITEEEMDFVTKLTSKNVFWIGLKTYIGEVDGENAMLKVLDNGGDCPFLNDGTPSSGRCSTEHYYICKKN